MIAQEENLRSIVDYMDRSHIHHSRTATIESDKRRKHKRHKLTELNRVGAFDDLQPYLQFNARIESTRVEELAFNQIKLPANKYEGIWWLDFVTSNTFPTMLHLP